jgi:hypothetical protein
MRKTESLPPCTAIAVGYPGMDKPDEAVVESPETPAGFAQRLRELPAWLGEYLRSLADFGFEQWLTPRLAPLLYGLGTVGSAYLVAIFVIDGFTQSRWTGLVRLLLIGPVLLLLLVTLLRIVLEICLVLFRIAVHLNQMAGHTEEIAGGMPRITFWRSWWRKEPPER